MTKPKHISIKLPNGTKFNIKIFVDSKAPDSANILISSERVKLGLVDDIEIIGDVGFKISPLEAGAMLIEGKSNIYGDSKRLNAIFEKDKKKAKIISKKITQLQTRMVVKP